LIIAFTSNTLQIEKGKSFAFVSGLDRKNIRAQTLHGPWWTTVYTSTQGANYSALFYPFNINGVTNRTSCYFMDIDDNILISLS
jgi:hypothetical protein